MATPVNVCLVELHNRRGLPPLVAGTPQAPFTGRPLAQPVFAGYQAAPGAGLAASFAIADGDSLPANATHAWVSIGAPASEQELTQQALANAEQLFPVEAVPLSRILAKPSSLPPTKGPVTLTVVRYQRRNEIGGMWPNHRVAGNAAYVPATGSDHAAVMAALAAGATTIQARILEVFR